jgi:hypothetical protein
VVVGAEAGAAGFGASCGWQPENRAMAAIPITAMMTDIFFTVFTSSLPCDITAGAYRDNEDSIKRAGSAKDLLV